MTTESILTVSRPKRLFTSVLGRSPVMLSDASCATGSVSADLGGFS
jgi:hypothetical protein